MKASVNLIADKLLIPRPSALSLLSTFETVDRAALRSSLETDDPAAEADGPAAPRVGEEDSFELMRRARRFRAPSRAAVRCVNRRAVAADGPALALVEELHVEEV